MLKEDGNPGKVILFKTEFCEFTTEVMQYLHQEINNIPNLNQTEYFVEPFLSAISELIRFSIRSLYRNAYTQYMSTEMGMDVSADTWEELYQSEVETNKEKHFIDLCTDLGMSISVFAVKKDNKLSFHVTQSSALMQDEVVEAKKVINLVRGLSLTNGKLRISEEEIKLEFSRKGFSLILITLKGLGVPLNNFRIVRKQEATEYRISFPENFLNNLNGTHRDNIEPQEPKVQSEISQSLLNLYHRLGYSIVTFEVNGRVKNIHGPIKDQLQLDINKPEDFGVLLNEVFYRDIFWGPLSVRNTGCFENYRLNIAVKNQTERFLYNISGTLQSDKTVETLWQRVNIKFKDNKPSEGTIFESLNSIKLINPYIPSEVMNKAKEALRLGLEQIPDEQKEITIMFADLVGFTQKIQKMNFKEVMELLNLTMSTIVKTIERHSGMVDKFLGDGIMCLYENPLSAVTAAVEIHNNLYNLNEFRTLRGEPPIELRIGINTGYVILGSVGTNTRMDWTALGDAVNTAARMEQYCEKNAILIAESTYSMVKNNIKVSEVIQRKLKGKDTEQNLYYVGKVSFIHNGRRVDMELSNLQD